MPTINSISPDGSQIFWNVPGVQGEQSITIGNAPSVTQLRLTTAQLLSLSTIPVTIIPAPGAGKYIVPQIFTAQLTYGGTPFSIANSGAGNTYLFWAGLGSGSAGSTAVGVMSDSANADGMNYTASSSQLFILPCLTGASVPAASILNQPLQISMDDALTLGNGSMVITISYIIVTPLVEPLI